MILSRGSAFHKQCDHKATAKLWCINRSGQVRSGQVRSGQVRSGQVRSGQVRSGQVRSGQVRSFVDINV